MTKFAVMFTFALSAAACSVGEVPANGSGGGDGGGSGSGDGGGSALVCADRIATPATAHNHAGTVPNPPTAAGAACKDCHTTGGTATPFLAAGTVYKQGTTDPQVGVTVRLTPSGGGATLEAITDTAGNFRIEGTIAFPALTEATACPEQIPMLGQINNAAEGNCNSGACHQVPGGAAGPIFLVN